MTGIDKEQLRVTAPAPDWYWQAMAVAPTSHRVTSDGCDLHYLRWNCRRASDPASAPGLLLVHGGGGHGHWWSHLAPYFATGFNVVAMDQAGMGDSGTRGQSSVDQRAEDMLAVMADAGLGPRPFVIGHSFGGLMSTRLGQVHGDRVGGIIIADSPVRTPESKAEFQKKRPRMGNKRIYATFDEALARFRLAPEQTCDNAFLVEHIGRHSIKRDADGFTWKFDGAAMGGRRFDEPFDRFLAGMTCRRALIYGEKSALLTPDNLAYMRDLMGPDVPVVGIPEAQHHLTLDQPIAFLTTARAILAGWCIADR